ncbi:hypothetical protein EV193_11985 [Herbihabitans rhizosphaerae]|uniref:Uncharacterized protein n=1 Tax=Herbihabitans rhizosphaerae TaxID=1872711 RepID=A0A4Q7KEM4_9PSEU|nr:hypothetical protein [Herbihabitans rhizosphaerae]RZS29680.1 hypothetical protein EV193_11985 [Herbihabitans rhizosphaerae]
MITRVLLGLAGLAGLAWGGVLVYELVDRSFDEGIAIGTWFVAGPVVHDLLVAPVVAVVGVLVTRVLPAPFRAPVAVGAGLTALLALLAFPLLWRLDPAPVNPGLHDGDYPMALAVMIAVVWLGVLVSCLLARWRLSRRREDLS